MLQITVFVVSNLWCVEWDVKLYYAIMYHVGCSLTVALCVSNCYYCRQYIQLSVFFYMFLCIWCYCNLRQQLSSSFGFCMK